VERIDMKNEIIVALDEKIIIFGCVTNIVNMFKTIDDQREKIVNFFIEYLSNQIDDGSDLLDNRLIYNIISVLNTNEFTDFELKEYVKLYVIDMIIYTLLQNRIKYGKRNYLQ
jgi:hypothetical protein